MVRTLILIMAVALPALPAMVTDTSLLADAYVAVPCHSYVGGCLPAGASVPAGLIFDRYAATKFIREYGYPDDWVGVMTPVDTNSAGWIVGGVLYYQWDAGRLGVWDGVSIGDGPIVGESAFVYQPGIGVVCCVTDAPFQIYAIDDDGFIFTNGAYGGGLWHVSSIDPGPGVGTALLPSVVGLYSDDDAILLSQMSAFFGRDTGGVLFAGGMIDGGVQWALVPSPEPGTLAGVGTGLLALAWWARRRARAGN